MNQKVTKFVQEKRVRIQGLPEFLAEAGSKASDTESPHFEDVVGSGASKELLVGQAKLQLRKKRRRILMSISSDNGMILPLLSLTRS